MTNSHSHKGNSIIQQKELSRLRDLEKVILTTEKLAKAGHYEWNWDRGYLVSCSEEYARIFGMSVPEILDAHSSWENTLKQIVADDVELYTQSADVLANTGMLDVIYRIQFDGKPIKHIRELSIFIKDSGKYGNSSVGILQDITEQVERERELGYRDELAQQAEAITDIGHFIYDELNDKYTYMSEGCARIFGMAVDTLKIKFQNLNDDLLDVHPDDRERVLSEYQHYRKSAKECSIEYRIIRSNGQIRWIRELSKARVVEEDRVVETLGVVQDITLQVSREKELKFNLTVVSELEAIADIGYFLYDNKNGRHLFISPGQARIVGLDVDTFYQKILTNNDYIDLIFEEDQPLVRKAYEQELREHGQWRVEYRVLKPDGELCWILETGKEFKRGETGVEKSIGLVRDITKQKHIEQELFYKDALAKQAETITDLGHFVYDELAEKYLFVSPGLAKIFDVDEASLVSSQESSDMDLARVYVDDREQVKKAYESFFINNDSWQVEYRLLRANGEMRWIRERGKAHLMSHGIVQQTVGVLQDITEQKNIEQALLQSKGTLEQQVLERTRELSNTVKQLKEQIEERKKVEVELDFLANHDALTGLPSLRLCKDRLERSLAAARRNSQMTAVMFLDLDGFKIINDTLGHESGDQVLIATAKRIQHEIREIDTVARIGGDEFIIILSNLSEVLAVKTIAENLIKQISQSAIIDQKDIDQNDVKVSASIGIALYPEHGATSDQLMRAADKAMYEVKKSGKNNFGFANPNELKATQYKEQGKQDQAS